jgi:hypothetical protein
MPWFEQAHDARVFKDRNPQFACRMFDIAVPAKVLDVEYPAGTA